MAKKLSYIIITIMILCFSMNIFFYNTYGARKDKETPDDIMGGAKNFLNEGKDMTHEIIDSGGVHTQTNLDTASLKESSQFFFNLLLAFGMVTAVIVGMIIGIKFMTSTIEEKAKIKEVLVPYVVSCVVIFGAFGIWKLAVNIFAEW